MQSGSMLIPNSLGKKTLLKIEDSHAIFDNENSFQDALAELNRQKRNPSLRQGNIDFLTSWVSLYSLEQSVQKEIESLA